MLHDIVARFTDGTTFTFKPEPGEGESPISLELAAVVAAAHRPVAPAPVPPPVPTPAPAFAIKELRLVEAPGGKDLGPLTTGMTVSLDRGIAVLAIPEGPVGSVDFLVDGVSVRSENSAPFAIAGDDGVNALPWAAPAGRHRIEAVAYELSDRQGIKCAPVGAEVTFQKAHVGTVPPPPPPRPQPVPLTVKRVAVVPGVRRGDGLVAKPADYSNLLVDGYEQNIIANDAGRYTWANVRSINALRGMSGHGNNGQGLYLDKGQHTLRGVLTFGNGWRRTAVGNLSFRNDRCHGIYANLATELDIDLAIFVDNGLSAFKLMGQKQDKIKRAICIGNANTFHCLYGLPALERVTCYAPGLYHDGSNWTGGLAIQAYTPVACTDFWAVGAGDPQPATDQRGGVYPMGLVQLSNWHPQYNAKSGYPALTGGRVLATDCVHVGWPRSTGGHLFTGPDNKPTEIKGWSEKKHSGRSFDYMPVVQALIANELSMEEAFVNLESGIRGLAA